jgi:ATP-dependent Lon protease
MTNKRLPEEDKAESTIQERVEVCQVAITAFEYYQTSFSYLENESMQEHFVGIPEGGGRDLISSDPLPPGSVYAVTLTDEDKVVLHRIEVGKIAGGSGNLRIADTVDSATKASLNTAFDCLRPRHRELGIVRELDSSDYYVQAVDLSGSG